MTDEQKQYIRMTKTPIPRLITSLSVPAVLSMLITSIYNMTDTYFVSKLGTSAAGAVGIVFALMAIIQSVGFTLGMGSSSYISRFLGNHDEKSANEYASGAAFTAILIGSVLLVFGLIFIRPLMKLLGSTETILPFATDYARYILIGAPLMCCLFVLNNVLRAEGMANLSMIGVTIGGVLNIGLDPLFIFTFNLGISGAAIATLISQAISFCILAFFFVSGKSIVKLNLKFVSRNLSVYTDIIKNGFPTFCRQGMASVASVFLAVAAKPYGDAAIAAMTIANKIYMLVRSLIIGVGQGFQPVAGYNYGAGLFDRIKKGFRFTVAVGTVICLLSSVVLYFNSRSVVAIFRKDDLDVIEIGSSALVYLCIVMPLLAYSTYVNQLLQCLGKSKQATFLAGCRQGFFYIPLILILSHLFGLVGIEITQPAADLLTFLISIPFQISFFRSVKGLAIGDKTK